MTADLPVDACTLPRRLFARPLMSPTIGQFEPEILRFESRDLSINLREPHSIIPAPHWTRREPYSILLVSHSMLQVPHSLLLVPQWTPRDPYCYSMHLLDVS